MDEEEEEVEEGIDVQQKEDEQEEEGVMDEEKEQDTTTFGTIEKRANLKAPTHLKLSSELCILGEDTI